MRNIALMISYDGTNYSGWQIQNKNRTIQGELETALYKLTQEKIRIIGSGRTDSGVHALSQIANFYLKSKIPIKNIYSGLNFYLPHDIRIINLASVKKDFHARYSALSRTYRYYINNSSRAYPFANHFFYTPLKHISPLKFSEYAKKFIGEHDFTAFCSVHDSSKTKIRNIFSFTIKEVLDNNFFSMPYLIIEINANAFLMNMVRLIIGTILNLMKKNISHSYIEKLFQKKDNRLSGPCISPVGLFLYMVKYPCGTIEWLFNDS